jgi:SAM-dependent methyltransferase
VLRRLLNSFRSTELDYGRDIIARWVAKECSAKPLIRLLDVGYGVGLDIRHIKAKHPALVFELHGVDSEPRHLHLSDELGVQVACANIERERLPYPDGHFDVVLCNQVLEHTKDLFWILSEMGRVLKPDGSIMIGVPNMASLHGRLMLLFGMQPSCVRVMGAHVRGFTARGMREFLECDGHFTVAQIRGSNFFPFPAPIASLLARVLPGCAVSSFFLVHKNASAGEFRDVLRTRRLATNYFQGPDRQSTHRV